MKLALRSPRPEYLSLYSPAFLPALGKPTSPPTLPKPESFRLASGHRSVYLPMSSPLAKSALYLFLSKPNCVPSSLTYLYAWAFPFCHGNCPSSTADWLPLPSLSAIARPYGPSSFLALWEYFACLGARDILVFVSAFSQFTALYKKKGSRSPSTTPFPPHT